MKLLMVVGGLSGCLIGIAFGVAHDSDWPSIFWHASAAALVAGWLMRWWGKIWINGLRQSRGGSTAKSVPTAAPAARL